jgi:hypothetical protein
VDRAARPQRCCDHRRGPRERDFAKARLAHHARRPHATPLVDALRAGALSVTTGTVAHCELAAAEAAERRIPVQVIYEQQTAAIREIRACAVHACELLAGRLGVPPRILDNGLWNRGQARPYSERPTHRTHTVFS